MKKDIEALEALLAGACTLLNDAVAIQKKIKLQPEKDVLRAIADALLRCWDARDHIFNERPDLKPEFMMHAEKYPEVHDAYVSTIEKAVKYEQEGRFGEATDTYNLFLLNAPECFYRRIIEFRVAYLKESP